MSLFRLVVILAVVALVWVVVRSVRSGTTGNPRMQFASVDSLPADVRQRIDRQLASDDLVGAVKLYRDATGAGLKASKAAVETYRWKQGGAKG